MSNTQSIGTFIPGDVHLRIPNYVNGRPLTAEDLKSDRDALLARQEWLGKAEGYGVIDGLMVQQSGAGAVKVLPGAGINRLGELIVLPEATTLTLTPPANEINLLDTGIFSRCDQSAGNSSSTLLGGAYLLVVAPVQQHQGLTAVRSDGGCSTSTSCVAKWLAYGLQFKSIRLSTFGGQANSGRTENMLAHFCFGSEELTQLAHDPFTFGEDFTGLDAIAPTDLTDCDLPLAVFFWTDTQQLVFVDTWSARRRVVSPSALDGWTGLLSEKRLALAQARFLQFQAQLGQIKQLQARVRAQDTFRYLPPVGYLPIIAPVSLLRELAGGLDKVIRLDKLKRRVISGKEASKEVELLLFQQLGQQIGTGFNLTTFFSGAPPQRLGLIDADSADFYLQRSWFDEALDLDDDPYFDVYIIRDLWYRYLTQRLSPKILAVLLKSKPNNPEQAFLIEGLLKAAAEPDSTPVQLYALFVKRVHAPTYYTLGETGGDQKKITGSVTLWHTYTNQADFEKQRVLESLVAQANHDNPGATINLEGIPFNDLDARLKVAMAAGNPPDLVLTPNYKLSDYINNGTVQPIDSWHTQDPNIIPNAYQSLSLDKKLYGVPQSYAPVALYYNIDRLPNPPDSLDALRDLAQSQHSIAIPTDPYFLYAFFTAFGGQLMDAKGKCTASQGGFAEAMKFLLELGNGAKYADDQAAAQDFGGGKVDMLVDGPWMIDTVRQRLGDSFDIQPLPPGPNGLARPLASLDGYYLPRGSANPSSAVALAEFLTTTSAQETFLRDSSFVPVRSDVNIQNLWIKGFVDAAQQADPYPLIHAFTSWWEPFRNMVTTVLNGGDPQTEIDKACREMDQANGL